MKVIVNNPNPSTPSGSNYPSEHVCIKIPFETLELSIAVDNNGGGRDYCFRENIKVFANKSEENLTEQLFGKDDKHASDGYDFLVILSICAKADLSRICLFRK